MNATNPGCRARIDRNRRASAAPRRRVPLLLLLSLACAPATAQEHAVNGDFATDLQGWEQVMAGSAEWNELDIDADAASGSALIRSDEALPVSRVYPLRQCIVLSEPGNYRVGASGRIAASGGRLVASVTLFSGATCSGGSTLGAGAFLDRPGQWEAWSVDFAADNMPRAMLVQLGIEKDAAGGTYSGAIDDVYLLQLVRVFADGFE